MIKHNLRVDQLFSIFFCALLLGIQGSLVLSYDSKDIQGKAETVTQVKQTSWPAIRVENSSEQQSANSELFNQVTAKSYLIVDLNSAAVLKARNQKMPLYPASTVKLMTALVALDTYDLNELLPTNVGINASGNKVGFIWGGMVSVKDLLAAILVNSGNDAAIILANHHPQGYQGFIEQMNLKAQSISLSQSFFTNPTGFDDYRQLTSSWDLSLLAREIIQNKYFSQLVSSQEMTITDQVYDIEYTLFNTNQLLANQEEVHGLKTGTTLLAQQVLISLWEVEENPVLIVVMGSRDRYQDTLTLAEWVRSTVTWQNTL